MHKTKVIRHPGLRHVWQIFNTSSHDVAAGLIIDAFGELRDQQEQVKEDMEVQIKL